MYTEKSSPPIAPLNEEPSNPPAASLGDEVQSSAVSENREQWLPWYQVLKALAIWVVSFLLLLFVPALTALPYLLYRVIEHGAPSAQALAGDKMLLFFSVLGILPAHLLTLIVTWMIVTDGGRRPFWKTIGFAWPERLSPATVTIMSTSLALALFGMAWLVTVLFGERKTDLDVLLESSIYARMATAFMAVVTAPLIEEVIYRGVLYPAIEKAAGVGAAIAFVSLLFAGVHVYQYRNNIAVILIITLLSIVLTVARAVTGKVLPSFIIHLVFNGIQSAIIVLGGFVGTDAVK